MPKDGHLLKLLTSIKKVLFHIFEGCDKVYDKKLFFKAVKQIKTG